MGGHLSQSERVNQTDEEVLRTGFGPIRGTIFKHGEKTVIGYLGIPYAKPPIGELRFRKPEPADSWTEIKDCTKYGPICPQTGAFGDFAAKRKVSVDEAHGLNLNVFVPDWKSAEFPKGLPVMVFIHGGGFEFSTAADYHDYSVSGSLPLKNVVLVTINYRLGVLGFLTTGDNHCRGNLGLWDQTLALKWVQKHIKSFGGDPGNVTVFGQSAGGASADLLSLSPHSRDLFHKVIPMAGSALCDFAIRTSTGQATVFKEFAAHHGFTGNDTSSLFSWYRSQPVSVLTNTKGFKTSASGFLTFPPNFDGDFFPKPLDELRKEAPKKPMMTGICQYEGLMLATLPLAMKAGTSAEEGLRNQITTLLKEDVLGSKERAEEVHRDIFNFYTKGVEGQPDKMSKKLVEFVGDYYFNLGILETAKASTRHGNDTYLYCFDFVNPTGFGIFQNLVPFVAATHCTELRYVLGEGVYSKFEPDGEDLEMYYIMTNVFTNFAKYGNPGWPKYDLDKPETHYRLTFPESEIRDVYHDGRCRFLEKILDLHKTYQEVVYGKKLKNLTSNI